jgi:hypothetical protein
VAIQKGKFVKFYPFTRRGWHYWMKYDQTEVRYDLLLAVLILLSRVTVMKLHAGMSSL